MAYIHCLNFDSNCLWKGFWRGNVPALLMVVPYTSIQFAVLHKVKSFAAGSSKAGTSLTFNGSVSESLFVCNSMQIMTCSISMMWFLYLIFLGFI